MHYKILNHFSVDFDVPVTLTTTESIRYTKYKYTVSSPRSEQFLVKSKEENGIYDYDLKDESLIEQMKNLKTIIETCECIDESFKLSEIVADFIQERSYLWYFLNLVNYKIEVIATKSSNPILPRLRRVSKQNTASSKSFYEVQSHCNNKLNLTLSPQEKLMKELMEDLESPKIIELESTE